MRSKSNTIHYLQYKAPKPRSSPARRWRAKSWIVTYVTLRPKKAVTSTRPSLRPSISYACTSPAHVKSH